MEILDAALSDDHKIIKSDSEVIAIVVGPLGDRFAVDGLRDRDALLDWVHLDLESAVKAVREESSE